MYVYIDMYFDLCTYVYDTYFVYLSNHLPYNYRRTYISTFVVFRYTAKCICQLHLLRLLGVNWLFECISFSHP